MREQAGKGQMRMTGDLACQCECAGILGLDADPSQSDIHLEKNAKPYAMPFGCSTDRFHARFMGGDQHEFASSFLHTPEQSINRFWPDDRIGQGHRGHICLNENERFIRLRCGRPMRSQRQLPAHNRKTLMGLDMWAQHDAGGICPQLHAGQIARQSVLVDFHIGCRQVGRSWPGQRDV